MGRYYRVKTPRDEEYIPAYLETHSQTKAALSCGVSRETIARAVRRAGIKLDGRKNNGKYDRNGRPLYGTKATDEQIVECSKTMNCREIAIKYQMSEERVYRRARRLGIHILSCGSGGHWRRRTQRYGCNYEDKITLKAVIERYGGICQICGRPVDINDIDDGHIRRMYPTVDHIIPLSKGGSHTWNNIQLAHMYCNAGKCDRTSEDGIHGKKGGLERG